MASHRESSHYSSLGMGFALLTVVIVPWTFATGCAQAVDGFGTTQDGGSRADDTAGGAAMGGAGGATTNLPCGIDCAAIETPLCFVAECNLQTLQCEVVPADDGTSCDDGVFCTVEDSCIAGDCVGGPENDCGLTPEECETIACNEPSTSCSTIATPDGGSCTSADLCSVGNTCQNGQCLGTPMDCFFAPVPNECYVPECNPMNGMCEPVVGNEGGSCTDASLPCTVDMTCTSGMCQGGVPKDCSHLTVGCELGNCDMTTGACFATAVSNNDPCDDLNNCTLGETCNNGQCTGGTPITACMPGDSCCPIGCVEATDADCSCNVNLAQTATASNSGGGSNSTGYGPDNWNDGVNGASCIAASCSSCQGWVANSTSPSGAWVQYDWPSAQQIGSMYVDGNDCVLTGCANGRTVDGGEVQYWDGSQWVTVHTFSGNMGDLAVTFNPKLNTDSLRIFNITAGSCGQASNTLIYEWYVYPGANCIPPP